ncbi:ycf20-like protein [Phtheirospermum japonicum]|uniref:Ycf20-like protein n=1 Tax=Phtheirospermum japonicum TaxID=374723 RepID=A0A830CTS6_9LAMI|nr:ycf20-like protein [Phtheirospermum japonicum]
MTQFEWIKGRQVRVCEQGLGQGMGLLFLVVLSRFLRQVSDQQLSVLELQIEGSSMVEGGANFMNLANLKLLIPNKPSKSGLLTALSFGKLLMPPFQLSKNKFKKRVTWSLRSAADGSRLNSSPTEDTGGGTRLIRSLQAIQLKLIARLKELRKNLPVKLFSFLVGFYCATAFATMIGQTGDWDVLSAALAVAVVEGIGALMYRASFTLVDDLRNLIIVFNYWKAGLSLGLFLDSFKY